MFTSEHFRNLAVESKVLYGLMLDRMSLSIKNKWFDEEKRAYIYFSVDDTMEMLVCKKNKAMDMIKALEEIGLIERKHQGQGKPAVIYVKSFMEEDTETDQRLVKSKFLKLNSSHIQYVIDSMKSSTSKVRNIKKYLLAALLVP